MSAKVDEVLTLMEEYMRDGKARALDDADCPRSYKQNRAASLLRDYTHYRNAGGTKGLQEILDSADDD